MALDPAPRRRYRLDWWVISLLLLGVGVRCLFANGYAFGTDDMEYSSAACRMVRGQPLDLECKYSLRFGQTVPLAVLYRILGVAPAVNALLPVLSALALAWIVHRWARELIGGRENSLSACALALTLPVSVFWSSFAFPDVPLALIWTLGLYLLHRAGQAGDGRRRPYLLAGLIFAYGHFLNPSMLYILPVLGLYGAVLLLTGRLDRRLLWTAGVFVGAIVLEMGLYRAFTGDFLFRWRLEWPKDETEGLAYPTALSRIQLLIWPFLFGITTFGLVLPFTAIGFAVSLKDPRRHLLLAWLAGYLALSLYNMVTVFHAYPRYFNVLAAPVVLLAVVGIRAVAGRRRLVFRGLVAALLLVSLAGSYRACMGTALTRTDPLQTAAALLKERAGPIWTHSRVRNQMRFFWRFENSAPFIIEGDPSPGGKAYVVIDEVLVRSLSAAALPPEWLAPPPGWKRLAHIPGYRPYPGFLGPLVESWFPRDRSQGVDVYEIGPGEVNS